MTEAVELPDEIYGFGPWLLWIVATRATALVDEVYELGLVRMSRTYGMVDGHPVPTPSAVAWLMTAAALGMRPDELNLQHAGVQAKHRSLQRTLRRAFQGEAHLVKNSWLSDLADVCRLSDDELQLLLSARDIGTSSVEPLALRKAIGKTFRSRPVADRYSAVRTRLIFRVYVPAGRLYASEAERLFSMFREWVSDVRGHGIRQDGYQTRAGKVYEFYTNENVTDSDMPNELANFSEFLSLCVRDPPRATDQLLEVGLSRDASSRLVARYGREIRRMSLDLRYEREQRVLAIRHSLESELIDEVRGSESLANQIAAIVSSLIPEPSPVDAPGMLQPALSSSRIPLTLNVNQQFITAVESRVAQNIQGIVNLGPSAKELLDLIRAYGGKEATILESAVYELEDPDARRADRVGAKRRLKKFLRWLSATVQGVATDMLEKYVEGKVGPLT